MDGELVVVAAPTYLKKQGTPKTLTDLHGAFNSSCQARASVCPGPSNKIKMWS